VRACGADVRFGAVPAESKRQGETGRERDGQVRNEIPCPRQRRGAEEAHARGPEGTWWGPTGSFGTHCLGTAAGRLHAFGLVAVFSLEATPMRGAVNWWWGRGGKFLLLFVGMKLDITSTL
jgi:hypothetical protein